MPPEAVLWILRIAVTLCAISLLIQILTLMRIRGNMRRTESAGKVVVDAAVPVLKDLPVLVAENRPRLASVRKDAASSLASARHCAALIAGFAEAARDQWAASSVFPRIRDSAAMLSETVRASRKLVLYAGGVRAAVAVARKLQNHWRNGTARAPVIAPHPGD
jgi:hypothetical protein